MSVYLGSSRVDVRLGTTTNLVSAIYIEDLTAYYQKQETFSKDQTVSCVDRVLSAVNGKFYTKSEVSAIIDGYEIPYRIRPVDGAAGTILLTNRVNNVLTPSADVSCIMPRTIVNQEQLGRDFFLQIHQPEPAVDVDFLGYESETLAFKSDGELEEMEGGKHYLMYFSELSSGTFFVSQKTLEYLSGSVSTGEANGGWAEFQMYDCDVNFLELSSDSRLVFPARVTDVSGCFVPRDFQVYLRQPVSSVTSSAYEVEFAGNDGETLVFKTVAKTSFSDMELSGEYLYTISELRENDLSSEFMIKQMTLADATI